MDLLHSAGIRSGRILLVTDGVAAKQIQPLQKTLAGTGAELAVMAIGSETGAPIPLPRGGFLKDADGAIVMPALEIETLRQLSGATGRRLMPMQIDDSDLDYLLSENWLPDTEQTLALDRTADAWEDQGYWLVLLLLPVALGLFRKGWILCLLPLLMVVQPHKAQAQAWDNLWLTRDQQGQRALRSQDYATAAELFENGDWAGTAAYQGEDYETAVEHFSGNDGADGWYNRGNALARAGKLDEAIEAYKQSLELQPKQQDAEENLALLEQLKQQQEEQQQQGEQGDQQQDGEQQEEQDQGQQEGGQQNQDQQSAGQQDDSQQQEQQAGDQQDPGQQQSADSSQPDGGQQEQEREGSAAPEEQEQQGEDQQPMQPGQEEQQQAGEQKLAEATQEDLEDRERDQAMEQWLRRVPDDPSGLLREKFRYESRKRQQQGAVNQNEQVW